MAVSRGGTGSTKDIHGRWHVKPKQNASRSKLEAPVPGADLTSQVEPVAVKRRCGEIWRTRCRAWVEAPSYGHDNHPSIDTALAVAQVDKIEPAVLKVIVDHPDKAVKNALAKNFYTDQATLSELGRQAVSALDWHLAISLSENSHLDPTDVQKLVAAPWKIGAQELVYAAIADREDCDQECQDMIMRESHRFLGPDTYSYDRVDQSMANNVSASTRTLSTISRQDDPITLSGVAHNLNTHPDDLQRLATNEMWWVRSEVASNPHTPLDTLEMLLRDTQGGVCIRAANNAKAPAFWLDLYQVANPSNTAAR